MSIEIKKVLQYWYLTEFFNQINFPKEPEDNIKANKRYEEKCNQKDFYPSKCLMIYSEFKVNKDIADILLTNESIYKHYEEKSDEIQVCVGKIKREICIKKLFELVKSEDYVINASYSDIALMGLKLNENLVYVKNSFNLSPIVWSMFKIYTSVSTDLYSLLTYEQYCLDMQVFDELLMKYEVISVKIINALYKKVCEQYLIPLFGKNIAIEDIMMIYQIFVDDIAKEEKEGSINYSDFKSNFFSEDLKMLETHIDSIPQQLKDYIRSLDIQENVTSLIEKRIELAGDKLTIEQKESLQNLYYKWLDISKTPLGKWPSKFQPSFMQQFAINMAISDEGEIQHTVSVNGPPGSGKTTLLKEIISHNIVARAIILSQYEMPDDAFKAHEFKLGMKTNRAYDTYINKYYSFKDDSINDFGVIVASSNNAAVENITKELPDQQKILSSLQFSKNEKLNENLIEEISSLFNIEESSHLEDYWVWVKEEDKSERKKLSKPDIYFTYYANQLLGKVDEYNEWGLISAPLGKNKNNFNYYQKVLVKLYYDFFYNNSKGIESRKENYQKIRNDFNRQLKIVEKLRNKLSVYSQAYLNKTQLINVNLTKIELNQSQIEENTKDIYELCANSKKLVYDLKEQNQIQKEKKVLLNEKKTAIDDLSKQLLDIHQDIDIKKNEIVQLEDRLGIVDWLFSVIKKPTHKSIFIEEKQNELEDLKNDEIKLREMCNSIKDIYESVFDDYHNEERKYTKLKEKILRNAQYIKNSLYSIKCLRSECLNLEKDNQQIETNYIDTINKGHDQEITVMDSRFWNDFFMADEINQNNLKAHTCNPWINEEYNRAREKLFYLSLQLHKEFILSSKCFMQNLGNFLLMNRCIKNSEKQFVNFEEEDKIACYSDLLNTLLLFTPVISTTFASVGRFLNYIQKPKQFGMLIIDEAGQAQPHVAVGAMYRARKVIVVGDPKQIEPVVKSEVQAIKSLVIGDLLPAYLKKTLSVQEFVDILNPYGRYLRDDYGSETWVGSPLDIHRRCISPMYDISNSISYNHSMKQMSKLPSHEENDKFILKTSFWFNIKGKSKNSKDKNYYVKEQGKVAADLVKNAFLSVENGGKPDIYVISPFTSVVSNFKKDIRTMNNSAHFASFEVVENWLKDNCGTIHTFQGKEANEVIFLLGCDHNSIKAVQWVNENIINVAVTRAKYRLCIIGDYQVWKKNELMKKTKQIIEEFNLQQLKKLEDAPINQYNKDLFRFLTQFIFPEKNVGSEENIDLLSTDEFISCLENIKLGFQNVTEDEFKEFHLTKDVVEEMDEIDSKNLIYGIRVYKLLTTIQNRYDIYDIDYASCSILLCKSMEGHIRNNWFEPLKFIENECLDKQKKSSKNDSKVMKKKQDSKLGQYIRLFREESIQEYILESLSSVDQLKFNYYWYEHFYKNLDNFRQLRNSSCHPSCFGHEQLNQLFESLFRNNAFEDVGTGKFICWNKSKVIK